MKKTETEIDNELRADYDMPSMKGVVRGKYDQRFKESSNVVVLAPDVAAAFPNEESVNEALRMLINVAKTSTRKAS